MKKLIIVHVIASPKMKSICNESVTEAFYLLEVLEGTNSEELEGPIFQS